MTNIFIKLNNYHFDEDYKILTDYLKSHVLPMDLERHEKHRFQERYGHDFELRNKEVVYIPLDLIVANPGKKQEILQDMYDDFKVGVGVGFQSFYDKVRMKYLNITRDEVKKFLRNQTYYQLTKTEVKTTNKPIVVSYPNERWSADLIDMNQYSGENRNNRYILVKIEITDIY